MKLQCWNCGASLDDVPRPISRHAACSACFNELHCCRLCRHYDAKRSMQCFEDRADPPLQKENANFCDFFSPSATAYTPQTTEKSSQAKDELAALFGSDSENDLQSGELNSDQPPQDGDARGADQASETLSEAEQARRKLDDLFN